MHDFRAEKRHNLCSICVTICHGLLPPRMRYEGKGGVDFKWGTRLRCWGRVPWSLSGSVGGKRCQSGCDSGREIGECDHHADGRAEDKRNSRTQLRRCKRRGGSGWGNNLVSCSCSTISYPPSRGRSCVRASCAVVQASVVFVQLYV